MYCRNCGNALQPGMFFCERCGMKTDMANLSPINANNANFTHQNQKLENDSSATTSMVCGIIGLFFAGIILGIIAITQALESKRKTNGVFSSKAKAGFILGIFDVAGAIISVGLMFLLIFI